MDRFDKEIDEDDVKFEDEGDKFDIDDDDDINFDLDDDESDDYTYEDDDLNYDDD